MTLNATDVIEPKSIRLTPIPQPIAIAFVAMTTLIMAYSHHVSVIPILIMYAMWFPFLYYKKEFTLRLSKNIIFVLLFSGYCLLSTIWSDYPGKSLYSATQYLSMILCALIIFQRTSLETFLKGLSIGVFLVLLPPLAMGQESYGYLFGSKNMVGFFSQIGTICSIFVLASSRNKFIQKIIFGALPLLISLAGLALSQSASSVISTATVLSICGLGFFIGKLPQSFRAINLILAVFGAASIIFCLHAFQIDLYGEVLEMFGKDRTLTGRTDLWADGLGFAMNHPLLGNGYSAFWVQGRPEAEVLWEEFYIKERMGFHFHNLYIQTWVDLGLIGLFFIVSIVFTFCYTSIKRVINEGSTIMSVLLLGLAFMFLTRSFVEVDIINPFGIGPFILFSTFFRVFARKEI